MLTINYFRQGMLVRFDFGLKLFGALIIIVVACLATLPSVSSYQANTTLHSLQQGAVKERAYNLVLSMLKDAETGQRGFLLGNDDSFLEPYNIGVAGIPAALEDLQRLASSDQERTLVTRISNLSRAKILETDRSIRLKRAGDSQAAIDTVASQRGKLLMDELRILFGRQLHVLAERRKVLRDELFITLGYNSALGIGAAMACLVVMVLSHC